MFESGTWYLALGMLSIFSMAMADTTIFNGAQSLVIQDATPQCLKAFDLPLSCDTKVQLLSYDMDRLEFDQTSLTALCTLDCKNSLSQLASDVSDACGNHSFSFNGGSMSATDVVDLFAYKYSLSCLQDAAGSFCLMVEDLWDVASLERDGEATWPAFSNKTFPNLLNEDGMPTEDDDGFYIDDSDDPPTWQDDGLDLPLSGQDYYQEGISLDWQAHGWPQALEYDEYPLEIQCSECFLAQYRTGIESQWGEVFDEVADQVWKNIRRNCDLDWELMPANNISTWSTNLDEIVWNYEPECDQIIEHAARDPNIRMANDLALAFNVPTAALIEFNDLAWNDAPPGNYCAPEPCKVFVIEGHAMGAHEFLQTLNGGVTETQCWIWNRQMDPKNLLVGEVVCVGPPGGAYTPGRVIPPARTSNGFPSSNNTNTNTNSSSVTMATSSDTHGNSTSGTSTFTSDPLDADLEPQGTDVMISISNVQSSTVSSTVFATTSTPNVQSSTVSSTVFATSKSIIPDSTTSSAASSPTAPGPTQSGIVSTCNQYAKAAAGDNCFDFAKAHGMTPTDFYELNTVLGSRGENCDFEFWEDEYYCVGTSS